jgi:cytochrome c-type biogenesis protein CcmH
MTKARRLSVLAMLAAMAAAPLLITSAGAQQSSDRAKQIGGKFMCMCGCNQVLTQCNHVGCTTSAGMLKELDHSVARGDSEDVITQMFVQEFGTRVYAEPPKSGFSLVAWSLPSIYLLSGTILVVFVISRWRKRPGPPAGSAPGVPAELLERARAQAARETED